MRAFCCLLFCSFYFCLPYLLPYFFRLAVFSLRLRISALTWFIERIYWYLHRCRFILFWGLLPTLSPTYLLTKPTNFFILPFNSLNVLQFAILPFFGPFEHFGFSALLLLLYFALHSQNVATAVGVSSAYPVWTPCKYQFSIVQKHWSSSVNCLQSSASASMRTHTNNFFLPKKYKNKQNLH